MAHRQPWRLGGTAQRSAGCHWPRLAQANGSTEPRCSGDTTGATLGLGDALGTPSHGDVRAAAELTPTSFGYGGEMAYRALKARNATRWCGGQRRSYWGSVGGERCELRSAMATVKALGTGGATAVAASERCGEGNENAL